MPRPADSSTSAGRRPLGASSAASTPVASSAIQIAASWRSIDAGSSCWPASNAIDECPWLVTHSMIVPEIISSSPSTIGLGKRVASSRLRSVSPKMRNGADTDDAECRSNTVTGPRAPSKIARSASRSSRCSRSSASPPPRLARRRRHLLRGPLAIQILGDEAHSLAVAAHISDEPDERSAQPNAPRLQFREHALQREDAGRLVPVDRGDAHERRAAGIAVDAPDRSRARNRLRPASPRRAAPRRRRRARADAASSSRRRLSRSRAR